MVSIEPEDFNGSVETIQNNLRKKLNVIFNNKLKNLEIECFIDLNDISNEDLVKEVMDLAQEKTPPLCHRLAKEKPSVFNQILKRYGSYNKFLIENNLKLRNMNGVWTKDIVLERMIQIKQKLGYMPKYNDIIKYKMYKDDDLFVGLHGAMNKCFEFYELSYVEFYKYCDASNIKLNYLDKKCMKSIYNKIKNNCNYLLNNETINLFKKYL